MKKIVISVGGSILITGKDDIEFIGQLADMLNKVKDERRIFVVVGGGRLAREYIALAREIGSDETYLDEIGIMATKMNAMILISALKGNTNPFPFDDLERAVGEMNAHDILVLSGIKPGQTTDTVAVELAERVGADLFINATSVDRVYDKDPKKNPEAKGFDHLTFEGLQEIVGTTLDHAGTNIVIDPVAAGVITRSKIRTYVLNGRDLDNFANALSDKEFIGTVIDN